MAGNDTARIQPGDFGEAVGLLTRLPVNATGTRGIRAAWAWPLAGALVGLLAAILGGIGIWLGLPVGVSAGITLGAQIILTGAMHEDGLADCADGFWGGWDKARRLEIMKDSAIGTYGTIALILSLVFRWGLLSALMADETFFGLLIGAAALSRVPMVGLMYTLNPARNGGLSADVGRPDRETLALTATTALLVAFLFCGLIALPGAIIVALLGWVVGRVALEKVGGQTGDVLGASQQISEIGILMVFVALLA